MGLGQTLQVPLAFSALVFLVLATVEWRRMPLCGRAYLGVATAFVLGAVMYPGMSIEDVLGQTREGLTYLLGAARIVALTAVLVSVTTFLRNLALR